MYDLLSAVLVWVIGLIETPEYLNPAYQRVVGEPGSILHGFLVIDEFISGRGTGGIRCTANVTLNEVARLAREMTLKFAFLRLPSGGAKAGLVLPNDITDEDRERRCIEFGSAIADLIQQKKYVGGLDMGTTARDFELIMTGAGVAPKVDHRSSGIDSNFYTALTVYASADALLHARNRSLRNTSVLVEGIGKVGSNLLRLFDAAGARIVGVSTLAGFICDDKGLQVDELLKLRNEFGDNFVTKVPGIPCQPPSELFEMEADLLVPGGGADSINENNLGKLKTRWIVPIANICASRAIENLMYERGIEYIPGFVSNIGGIFCWYLGRLSPEARDALIRDGFKRKVSRLIAMADQESISIAEMARRLSETNLISMKKIEAGDPAARRAAYLKNLSPKRIGYILGSRLLGPTWSSRSNPISRSYYYSRFFD